MYGSAFEWLTSLSGRFLNIAPQVLIASAPAAVRFFLKQQIQDWIFSGTHLDGDSGGSDDNQKRQRNNARSQISLNIEYVSLLAVTAVGLFTVTVHGLTTIVPKNSNEHALTSVNDEAAKQVCWLLLWISILLHFIWLYSKRPGGWSIITITPDWQRWYFLCVPVAVVICDKLLMFLFKG